MKRKAKLYGPVLLAALLCALVFATGALKKPKIFENITTDYMAFQKKLPRYSLADGDEYGVIPMGRRGWMHLPAGEYRLRWVIGCDGDNILRLTNTNDATITPSEFTIPAGAGDGELHFTVEEDCEDFKIEFEFAAGTYMDIYQVKLYTPEYQDDAFTLLFFAVGASILWLMIGTGRLTRENMAPVLFIALAVLIGSAPALKTTFVIGHDGTYHMARLLNLADGLKNGQFPVRMGGFAYDGYGGVMSVFYPDTFLYPFALMILGGASAVYVCNVFSVALNIGAALSMYVAAKRLFEKRWAATGASILYTLASYRVVNVFTRVAFGEALDPSYKEYQKQVRKNAQAMAEAFAARGYKIVSGGTDNHLMLIDLRTKFPDLTGKQAEKALVQADITTNKNMVPFDSRSPFQTSGIRVGTPAITTRGLKEDQMETIVSLIDRVLSDIDNETEIAAVRKEVNDLMANYPLFAW